MKFLTGSFPYNSSERKIFFSIIFLGLVLRIIYLREFSALPHFGFAIGPDVQEYHERALGILNGHFFPEIPDIHAPLYSFFLALCYRLGCSIPIIRGIQILLNFAAYISIVPLIRKHSGSFRLQMWYLFFAAAVPILFFHQGELVSETLLAPLIAMFFWMRELFRERRKMVWQIGAGLALGGMILTHGLMLFFAAGIVACELYRKNLKKSLLLLAGMAILSIPVLCAKTLHYGKFTGIQSNSAYNLWIGNNPNATGGCYLRPGKMWRTPLENGKIEARKSGISENRFFLKKVGSFYIHHPGKAALLLLKKVGLLFYPYEPIAGADSEALIRDTNVQLFGNAFFVLLLCFAGCGIFFAIKNRHKEFADFYILTLSIALGLILTVVSGRYRQSLMPGLLLLGAVGAVGLQKHVVWMTAVVLGIFWGFMLPQPVNSAEYASIAGEAYYHKKDFANAEKLLLFAERSIDDPARFDNLLGAIAEEKGDHTEAERRYRRAILLEPDFADAYLNLGVLLFNAPGRRDEAVSLIKKSLDRKKSLPSAYNFLAIDAVSKEDHVRAEKLFALALKYDPDNTGYQKNLHLCQMLSDRKKRNLKK